MTTRPSPKETTMKLNATSRDSRLINKIAAKAYAHIAEDRSSNAATKRHPSHDPQSGGFTIPDLALSLTACHLNDIRLDLPRMLEVDGFNLCHDVFGICANVCHTTGKLQNFFVPRVTRRPLRRAPLTPSFV